VGAGGCCRVGAWRVPGIREDVPSVSKDKAAAAEGGHAHFKVVMGFAQGRTLSLFLRGKRGQEVPIVPEHAKVMLVQRSLRFSNAARGSSRISSSLRSFCMADAWRRWVALQCRCENPEYITSFFEALFSHIQKNLRFGLEKNFFMGQYQCDIDEFMYQRVIFINGFCFE
jgi:hypothetical protein